MIENGDGQADCQRLTLEATFASEQRKGKLDTDTKKRLLLPHGPLHLLECHT